MNTASAAGTVVNAASKASTFANRTVEAARFEALKEPLGFIKLLQFLMAILAFAVAVNGGSSFIITVPCQQSIVTTTKGATVTSSSTSSSTSTARATTTNNQDIWATYSYPYDLSETKYQSYTQCQGASPNGLVGTSLVTNPGNIVSSAQFFVFTGVMAFLYSLLFGIIYVFFKHKYDNIVYLPLIDFAITVLFTIFWFAGSIAWAAAIGTIQTITDPIGIIAQTSSCRSSTDCIVKNYPGYGNLTISCILGFGNLILWGGDVWFVLKETSWYKIRRQQRENAQNQTNNPISRSDINISVSAAYNPNNKI